MSWDEGWGREGREGRKEKKKEELLNKYQRRIKEITEAGQRRVAKHYRFSLLQGRTSGILRVQSAHCKPPIAFIIAALLNT